MRTRIPALTAVLLLSASCAAPQPEPNEPGAAQPAAAGAEAAADPKESVLPPSDPQARKVGQVILECDGHLRTWTTLMSQPRNEANQQKIGTLSIALGSYVAKNREILESQVISGGARNRGIASAALGFCGDPAAAPLIANNVSAEDTEVASKALLGLGVLCAEDTPLSPILGAVMRTDASPALLSNAAFCLYQLAIKFKRDPDGSMTAAFTQLLGNPDLNIRAQSVLGLGLVQATSAVPQITDLLAADPVPSIRTCAAYALGQIGASESIMPLISALSDSDAVTAGTARASLARFYGSDLGPQAAAWREATPK
jgi:hypothetical protein